MRSGFSPRSFSPTKETRLHVVGYNLGRRPRVRSLPFEKGTTSFSALRVGHRYSFRSEVITIRKDGVPHRLRIRFSSDGIVGSDRLYPWREAEDANKLVVLGVRNGWIFISNVSIRELIRVGP